MVGYTLRGKGGQQAWEVARTRAHTVESSVLALILSAKTQDHQGPYQDITKVSEIKGLVFNSGNLN